jgi:glutaminyl-tRNA synthetase
MSNEEKES